MTWARLVIDMTNEDFRIVCGAEFPLNCFEELYIIYIFTRIEPIWAELY